MDKSNANIDSKWKNKKMKGVNKRIKYIKINTTY